MFETSFLLFDSYIYPGVFCALSVVGLLVFFAGKYREMSLVYKDFILVSGWVGGVRKWMIGWFGDEKRWWKRVLPISG